MITLHNIKNLANNFANSQSVAKTVIKNLMISWIIV